jgi:hypothetical protein
MRSDWAIWRYNGWHFCGDPDKQGCYSDGINTNALLEKVNNQFQFGDWVLSYFWWYRYEHR